MMNGRFRIPFLTSSSRRCCSILVPRPNTGPVILDPDLVSAETLISASIANLNKPKLLSVAIVGQPNVGKSTLFNKLTAHSRAIVTPIPGTTRDRRDGKGHLAGLDMNVIDTGGFDDRGAVTGDIKDQIKRALMQADVILYVVDGKHGINTIDMNFSQWLRKTLGVIEKYYPKAHSLKREVVLVRTSPLHPFS
jgi:tRNA U34 5-carboxymethylaminomethyl modifying GTPase MnmE/TrmE